MIGPDSALRRTRLSRLSRLALSSVVAALGVARSVTAGPPLITDDPDTPGRNRWEINVSYDLSLTKEPIEVEPTRRQKLFLDMGGRLFDRLDLPAWINPPEAKPRTVRRRVYEHEAPLVDINYGVTDRDQIKAEFPVLLLDGPDNNHEDGFGPLTLGYKYRFLDEDRFPVSVSVYPQVELATSARRLGENRKPLYILPLQVGRHSLDDRVFVYGEVGLDAAPGKGADDALFYGVAAEWEIVEHLVLAGEIAGSEPTHGDGPSDVVFNLGFKWDISESATLMAAMGRSFYAVGPDRAEFIGFWGIQLRF